MGGIEIHPAVQHIADKGYERMTMDEAAIVHTMRRSLAESEVHARLIRQWLQEINPLGLKGPALSEWATDISEWVLPTQMRRSHATATRELPQGSREQYQDGDGRREATEASRRHSAEQSAQRSTEAISSEG